MAPHSSTLAWKIPWTEEPGGLQSMGSLQVRHDWVTSLSLFTFMHWRRKWQPTPVFFLENPRDGGAWWAAVYGVAQSRTQLKWLSSSSNLNIQKSLLTEVWTYLEIGHQQTNIFHVENSQIRNMTLGCLIQRTLAGINQSVLTFLCKVSQLFV